MPTDKRFTVTVPTGITAHIRLAPEDVARAIHAAEEAGIAEHGMSLQQVCKWGIVRALWQLEQDGYIPETDSFEYASLIQQYASVGDRRKALTAMAIAKRELSIRDTIVPVTDDIDEAKIASISQGLMEKYKFKPSASASATPTEPREPPFGGEEPTSIFGMRLPRALRMRAHASAELNARVMSTDPALVAERANLSAEDRAKWLLNSESAAGWSSFFSPAEFDEAANIAVEWWPAAEPELRALRAGGR